MSKPSGCQPETAATQDRDLRLREAFECFAARLAHLAVQCVDRLSGEIDGTSGAGEGESPRPATA